MPPVYGKDGFSDCRKICDPDNGYWQSCKDLCKGIYSFGTSGISTVLSLTPTPAIKSSTPTPPVPFSAWTLAPSASATSTPVAHGDAVLPESNDVDVNVFVYILIGTVFTFIIGFLLYCLRKRLSIVLQNIMQWSIRRFCKRGQGSEVSAQPAIEMNELKMPEESERLLTETDLNSTKINKNHTNKSANSETFDTVKTSRTQVNGTRTCSRLENDNRYTTARAKVKEGISSTKNSSGIKKDQINSTKVECNEGCFNLPNDGTGSVHYDDGKFHAISHDADEGNDNDEIDSESESETDSGIVHTDTGTLETLTDDKVSKRTIKKKGVVRVITEIIVRH